MALSLGAAATLRAQASSTEVWQVVGSLPTIPSSGLPTVVTPSPTLTYPSGVATTSSGDLVVADSGNDLVRVFDATTGAENLSLRLPLAGSASFSWPADVKVDACGHILVTDYGHDSLRVFASDGSDLGSITGLSLPWGLALAPGTVVAQSCTVNGQSLAVQGEIAVVNSGSGEVNVYNGDLTSKLSFNSTGGTSQLQAPIAVAIDSSTGDFFVSDSGVTPKTIDVYSSTGTYLFAFSDSTHLNFPNDLAFDSTGRLFVSDGGTQLVDVFSIDYDQTTPANSTATFLFDLSQDNMPGTLSQFLAPSGLAFDSAGQLLVTTGTYDPDDPSQPLASTQYVLVLDRPSLAITGIAPSSSGVSVAGSAVPPGTPLTFTVTAISSTGQVDGVVVTGTVTGVDGTTQTSLPSVSLGSITAGTPATATFTYTVPASITSNGTISFTAGATGTITNNTTTTTATAPAFAPLSVPVVVTGDTTAPTTTATATPSAPQSNGWYNTAVSISLSASDNAGGSGIQELDYSFSGTQQLVDPLRHQLVVASGQTTITTNVAVSQDGLSTLTYWAIDKAGNTEAAHTLSVQVDRNPPYAVWSAPSPAATSPAGSPTQWWNRSVTVPFRAVDRNSGVQSYSPSSGFVSFSAEGADQHQTVTITSKSGVVSDSGNGINTSPTVNIDLTPPVAGTPTASPAPNSNGWNNSSVQVTFTATDALSGFLSNVAASGVSGDKNARRVLTFGQEGRSQSAASQTFSDLAGNVSNVASYSTPINIDLTPPSNLVVSLLNTGNLSQVVSANSHGWFNTLVTARLTATDNLSGFAAADDALGQKGDTTSGLETIALGEGLHAGSSLTISDLAGNVASASIPAVNIDVTAPAITGITVAPAPNANGWNNTPVQVTFSASDNLAGFSAADSASGSAGDLSGRRVFTFTGEGSNQSVATQTFTDLAGNVSSTASYSRAINIDETAPSIVVSPLPTPAWVDTGFTPNRLWYAAPVTVTFTAADSLSGFTSGQTAVVTQTLGEGKNETASQTFTDLAGNSATAVSSTPVDVDLTPPSLTATVTTAQGSQTITFTASDSGSGLASCTVTVDGVLAQQTCDPMTFGPADSGKTIKATAIDHVGHSATTTNVVSFAPPEAYNQFDPVSHDVLVYGVDPTSGTSLGVIAPVTLTHDEATGVFGTDHDGHRVGPFPAEWWTRFAGHDGKGLRIYRVNGASGNSLTLVEAVQAAGHEIHVQVIGFQYTVNGTTEPFIFAPDATKNFEWSLNADGSLKGLNQDMRIGHGQNGVEVQADYSSRSGQTSVHVKVDGPDSFVTLPGLALLRMATNHAAGNLVISADGLTPVPGPAGSTLPYSGGYTWGGGHDGSGGDQSGDGDHGGDHDGDHHDGDHGGHHDGDHDGDHSTNHGPVVTVANQGSHEGDVIALQVTGTDPDGDALTYAATGLPPGLAMSASGLIGGTLSYTTSGTYQVTVIATDARGAHGSATFTWTVANVDRAPTITTVPDQSNNESDVVSLQVAAQDPDGDTLSYAASGLPWALVINSTTGLISGTLSDSSAGTYTVTVTVTDAGGQSTAGKFTWTVKHVDKTPSPAGAAKVRHAPSLSGGSIIAGSVQMMSPENVVFNGGATITGNLFVPGLPTLQLNGTPASFGGTEDASGAGTPAGYVVTLNGGSTLGHLIRREDAVALPVVATPPAASGTRSISLNNAKDEVGDFTTVKNLTLNGNVGAVTVPAGNYGAFTANGNGGFVLGVAGTNTPAVYTFDSLTLNGQSTVTIVGPVIITLRNGQALSGSIGDQAHPEWTVIAVASGGLELNSGVTVSGTVVAPSGTVTIDGNAQIVGTVMADRLTLNGGARLTLIGQ